MLKHRNKVLGINARSSIYLRANSAEARDIADNKLRTKELLLQNGISAADLITVIHDRGEMLSFPWDSLPPSFVIKPNRGLGGEGIMILFNRLKNGNWLSTNKRQVTVQDFQAHISNILDGNFSLLNTPDIALLETRLSVDPLFKRFTAQGIPDIRVIVYNMVPVMAMLRLPTKESGGKANLAQGGLGIGIDIASGITTHVITKGWMYEREIDRHPDTNAQLRGVRVPYWPTILKTAMLAARVVGLKYAGVDISVDKKKGPVVLELNARPGLGIQVANMAPLRERLDRIKGLTVSSPERGIAIAHELFGGHMATEVSNMTGRQVVGPAEIVTIYGKEGVKKKIRAKIDTGADGSSIDNDLARELGFGEAIEYFQQLNIPTDITVVQAGEYVEQYKLKAMQHPDIAGLSMVSSSHGNSVRMKVRVTVTMAGYTLDIEPNVVDRSHLEFPMLVGKRNLTHYLIDTTKPVPPPLSGEKITEEAAPSV